MRGHVRIASATSLSIGIVITAAVALAGSSVAAQRSQRPLTFDGHCQLTGSVRFKPRMTSNPRVVRNYPRARGTCSGSLTEHNGKTVTLSNAPVRYRAEETGSQESCASNQNAPGKGQLIFKAGRLHFAIVENRVSGTAHLSLTGARGGSATAVANVNSSNPQRILEKCANGGVSSVPVSLTIQTTPSISG
jgi:hypothetical protein